MEEKSKEQLLEGFSERLIKLGEEIEQKLEEKNQLEGQLKLKEKEVMGLEKDIFSTRIQLAKLNIKLAQLEVKRKEFAEKKLLLEKKEK